MKGFCTAVLVLFLLPVMAQELAPETPRQSAATSNPDTLGNWPGAAGFVDDMVARHHFDRASLTALLAQARLRPSILSAMARPSEAKPWYEYRQIFVDNKRIAAGSDFWKQHAATLKRAEQEYGVPAAMIVAIIGVETFYGRNTGSYRVLDALATLAFSNGKRADYFREELEHYLLLARDAGFSPLAVKGSYAGAMGISQFMPSSYRAYGIDFDGDGHRDLWANPEDAIGSVANYFRAKGWVTGAPVAVAVRNPAEPGLGLANRGWSFRIPMRDWPNIGVMPEQADTSTAEAMLLELQGESAKEYWLAYQNFYVITRYNHSFHYAMAAWQLSLALQAAYAATP